MCFDSQQLTASEHMCVCVVYPAPERGKEGCNGRQMRKKLSFFHIKHNFTGEGPDFIATDTGER